MGLKQKLTLTILFTILAYLWSSVIEYHLLNKTIFKVYIIQGLLLSYLIIKNIKIRDFLLPSSIAFFYIQINLILGGYLAPRGYGFFKEYYYELATIQNYRLIIFYILCTQAILASITIYFQYKQFYVKETEDKNLSLKNLMITIFLLIALYIIMEVGLIIPFQLGFLLPLLFHLKKVKLKLLRFIFYLLIIFLAILFHSFDKRNIIIFLIGIIFFEMHGSMKQFVFSLKHLLQFSALLIAGLILVLIASINRGYGQFESNTPVEYLSNLQSYITSDIFIDGITDNLELNYNYGATNLSMEYVIEEKIQYQYGKTLIKPLFLWVPRDYFLEKPESFMHLYTRNFDYNEWSQGSSLPVIFPIDLFANFSLFGLFALIIFYWIFNKISRWIYCDNGFSIKSFFGALIVIIHLLFIRGSGLDILILYIILACLSFLIYRLFFKIIEEISNG